MAGHGAGPNGVEESAKAWSERTRGLPSRRAAGDRAATHPSKGTTLRTACRRPLWAAGATATAAVLAASLAVTPASAAPSNNNSQKLRDAVTLEGVTRHLDALQAIADANGDNRYAGLPGYELSADYVAAQLRAAGYQPTFQEFTYLGFRENSAPVMQRTSEPTREYTHMTDFATMSFSGAGDVEAPVARPAGDHRGCYAADFDGFAAGSIALVQRGAPAGFTNPATGDLCTFRLKVDNAVAAGATGVLVHNNVPGGIAGTLGPGGLSAVPALASTEAVGQELITLMASGPVTLRMVTDTSGGELTTRNVFAELPGKSKDSNVVMVGAHLDSVAAGPGISDNGSGSAGILETAIQMAKTKPFNTVRFAWWSAEESGLIGSNHYVDSLGEEGRSKIALYLNFDMIGSPNYARFIYDGDNNAFPAGPGQPSAVAPEGSGQIEALFEDYFASQGLASQPTPFSGRSDYGRFIFYGIPSGGLFTGAEGIMTEDQAAKFDGLAGVAYDECYHLACDTIDNVNLKGLDEMTDAVAHAVITYAQNTEPVNGVKGKGNFKRPATGADGSGTGTGSGGGLHDDHDHEEPDAA
jgi:Zn-dependent M28 family amino/carboxypeptidase